MKTTEPKTTDPKVVFDQKPRRDVAAQRQQQQQQQQLLKPKSEGEGGTGQLSTVSAATPVDVGLTILAAVAQGSNLPVRVDDVEELR